jgi:PAS domain S-box-containing protein
MAAAEVLIQTALLGEAVDGGPALVFVADEGMRYIAVNQTACDVLGYTREELLQLGVQEVAREPEAGAEYDEMLARGFRHGTALLTRKDGSTVDFAYRATKTKAAGLTFFVSVGFVEVPGTVPGTELTMPVRG